MRIPANLLVCCAAGTLALAACTTSPTASYPPGIYPSADASMPSSASYAEGQLEQLVAPIALYPDALLAQILIASTYPLEVVQAARWVQEHPNVQGKALEDAMQQQTWDPSVRSLTALPQVLAMMNEKLPWTQQLGDAFLANQTEVLKAVQRLRRIAHEQGNLNNSSEQTVSREGETIKIEASDPGVIYVPTYDPTVIYGSWPYPVYPPYYYYPPGYVPGSAFWTFAIGVAVGNGIWGNCDWHNHNVHVDHHRYNNFNRSNITDRNWRHNVEHRRGVPYRDQRVAQQYNRGTTARDAQARDQFRGRTDAGQRQASGFGGASQGRQAGNYANRGASSRQISGGARFSGGARAGGGRGGRR